MDLKTSTVIVCIACIYFNRIVSCESTEDIMKQYNPLIQKQLEIVSSTIEEYHRAYDAFKSKLDEEFTDTIDTIAATLYRTEAKMTSIVEKDESPKADYCLNAYSHELDNFEINLKNCYPTSDLIFALKGIKLLDLLRTKIAGVFNECKEIYPQEQQASLLLECIKTSKENSEMYFDLIRKDTSDSLENAKSYASICIAVSKASMLISNTNMVLGLLTCLGKVETEFNSNGQTNTS